MSRHETIGFEKGVEINPNGMGGASIHVKGFTSDDEYTRECLDLCRRCPAYFRNTQYGDELSCTMPGYFGNAMIHRAFWDGTPFDIRELMKRTNVFCIDAHDRASTAIIDGEWK